MDLHRVMRRLVSFSKPDVEAKIRGGLGLGQVKQLPQGPSHMCCETRWMSQCRTAGALRLWLEKPEPQTVVEKVTVCCASTVGGQELRHKCQL